MYKKFLVIIASALLIVAVGCSKQVETVDTPDTTDPTQTIVDVTGTYTGTLPCDDCEGIEMELTVNEDGTYELISTYLSKTNTSQNDKGEIERNEDGTVITLSDMEEPDDFQFKVGENTLTKLDTSGVEIRGNQAAEYILTKTAS